MTYEPVPIGPRIRFQPWMAVAGAAVVAVAGLGLVLMRGSPAAFASDGGRMHIEVVAPVEPVVQPGAVMEVGELVDGYTHIAIQPQSQGADIYDEAYQTAWIEPSREPEVRVWRSDVPVVQPTEPQPESVETASRFGFDAPGPDYAAERRARQERLDRIQAEQASRGSPGAPVTSPGLDRDSAFY